MIREVICKRWFLPKRFVAIVLYPFIFYKGEPREDIRRHELSHILQIKRDGLLVFYAKYLWWSIRYGYHGNPFEVEARLHQRGTVIKTETLERLAYGKQTL